MQSLKEIRAGRQFLGLMRVRVIHEEINGFKDVFPIPKTAVQITLRENLLCSLGRDGMKENCRHTKHMECINQKLREFIRMIFGIVGFGLLGPKLTQSTNIFIRNVECLMKHVPVHGLFVSKYGIAGFFENGCGNITDRDFPPCIFLNGIET